MSLENSTSKTLYTGNGITREFSFPFKVWEPSQVRVMLAEGDGGTETDVSAEVTVSLSPTGGTVAFAAAPAPGTTLAILRQMPFLQEDRYITGTRFDPHEIEDALDIACAERQELRELALRHLTVPATSSRTPEQVMTELFDIAAKANEYAAEARETYEAAVELKNTVEQKVMQTGDEQVERVEEAGSAAEASVAAMGQSQIDRLDGLADMSMLTDGNGAARQVWMVAEPIAAGTTVTLPNEMHYIPHREHLYVALDGMVLSPRFFTEVGDINKLSNQLTLNIDIEAGQELTAWAVPLGRIDVEQIADFNAAEKAVYEAEASTAANAAAVAATAAQFALQSAQVAANTAAIANLKAVVEGVEYIEMRDESEAYEKFVRGSAGAVLMPYAAVTKLYGRSMAWNQLVDAGTSSVTLLAGHRYFCRLSGVDSILTGTGQVLAVTGGADMVCDLTLLFGAGNEPPGVEAFRALFPASYYPPCAGMLTTGAVDMVSRDEGGAVADTLAVPAAVLALNGYGCSVGDVRNWLDWENMKFHRLVQKRVYAAGDVLAFDSQDGGAHHYAILPLENYVAVQSSYAVDGTLACSHYLSVQRVQVFSGTTGISGYYAGRDRVIIYDEGWSGIDDAKAWVQAQADAGTPLTVLSVLAEPEVVDLAGLGAEDNLVRVLTGGSLVFRSVLGDGARIPVASEVSYTLKLTERGA